MESVKTIAADTLWECLDNGVTDWTQIKNTVKEDISRYLVEKTNRKPMILPVIMNV